MSKAGAKRSQLTTKHQVSLPPLMVMGEPKILHHMTMTELKVFVTVMLKCVYGMRESMAFCFADHPKPIWWPEEVKWSNQYFEYLPKSVNRGCYLRHLITSCYLHYKAEDILYLFDGLPNEPPRWRLSELSDGSYELIKTSTSLPVWHFQNSYRVLTLLALEAKQKSMRETTQKKKVKLYPQPPDLPPLFGPSRQIQSTPPDSKDDSSSSPPDSDSDVICLSQPTKLYADRSDVKGDLFTSSKKEAVAPRIKCQRCETVLPAGQNLLQHDSQCILTTSEERAKAKFLFPLGLIPRVVAEQHQPLRSVPLPTDLSTSSAKSFLTKIPFSSELGKMMLGIHEAQKSLYGATKSEISCTAPAYEKYCEAVTAANLLPDDMKSVVVEEKSDDNSSSMPSSQSSNVSGGTPCGSTFIPVVYRPPRLISHYHQLKLDKADWENWWKETYRKGLDDESYDLYLRECKPVVVKVAKLSDEQYSQHCPPQPRTSERQRQMTLKRRLMRRKCCDDDCHDHQPKPKRVKTNLLSSPQRSITASIALSVKRRTLGLKKMSPRKPSQRKMTPIEDSIMTAMKGRFSLAKQMKAIGTIRRGPGRPRKMGPKSKMVSRLPMTLDELNWALANPIPPDPSTSKVSGFHRENPIIVLDKGKVTPLSTLMKQSGMDLNQFRRFRIQPVSPKKSRMGPGRPRNSVSSGTNPRLKPRYNPRIKMPPQHIDRSLLKIKCRPAPGEVLQYRLVKQAGGDLKLVPKALYSEEDEPTTSSNKRGRDLFHEEPQPGTPAENFAKAVEKTAQLTAEKRLKLGPQTPTKPMTYGPSTALWSMAKSASIANKHTKAPSILRKSFRNSPVKAPATLFADSDPEFFNQNSSSPVKHVDPRTTTMIDTLLRGSQLKPDQLEHVQTESAALPQSTPPPTPPKAFTPAIRTVINKCQSNLTRIFTKTKPPPVVDLVHEESNDFVVKAAMANIKFVHIAEAEKPVPRPLIRAGLISQNGSNVVVKKILLPNRKGMATVLRVTKTVSTANASVMKPSTPAAEPISITLDDNESPITHDDDDDITEVPPSGDYSPVTAIRKMLVCNPRLNATAVTPAFTKSDFEFAPRPPTPPTPGRESPKSLNGRKCLMMKPLEGDGSEGAMMSYDLVVEPKQ